MVHYTAKRIRTPISDCWTSQNQELKHAAERSDSQFGFKFIPKMVNGVEVRSSSTPDWENFMDVGGRRYVDAEKGFPLNLEAHFFPKT